MSTTRLPRRPRRSAAALPAAALAVALLAGCTGAGAGADSAEVAASDGGGSSDAAGGESGGDEAADMDLGAEARQVVTEGSVVLEVEDPRAAANDAALLVEHAGGRVAERVESAGSDPDGDSTASLVVRVPADEVSRVLEQLRQFGEVRDVQLTSTDVTGQVTDLDARVRALETSVGRLEVLLAEATTTQAVIEAEQTLTDRQEQLERLLSQRALLADRVEMATFRLEMWTADAVPQPAATGFWGGVSTGWESLVTAVGTVLLVVGVLLPWALAAGVVALLVIALRSRMRRQATTASPVATPPPAAPVGVGAPAQDDAPRD
ncbi:DUF4349 domain-containing protein [Actinotalea sp. Marseille-Q4924]|uniref:DUF4349 domain-containing protein n=1 Tax=Actinotalea sp. Marseille-Q4924 TaxID=2866571 RepID=UPI001CE40C45|nr:DUF4349 domain-containing protein [Actinotalea sp. Marseille-Q4924]